MKEFKMVIPCMWCDEEITLDPTPVYFDAPIKAYVVDGDRQQELIERHGWKTYGGTFCSDECRIEYTAEKNIDDWEEEG